jgi:hypothetical protein
MQCFSQLMLLLAELSTSEFYGITDPVVSFLVSTIVLYELLFIYPRPELTDGC